MTRHMVYHWAQTATLTLELKSGSPDIFRPPPANEVLVLVLVLPHEQGHRWVDHSAREVEDHGERVSWNKIKCRRVVKLRLELVGKRRWPEPYSKEGQSPHSARHNLWKARQANPSFLVTGSNNEAQNRLKLELTSGSLNPKINNLLPVNQLLGHEV